MKSIKLKKLQQKHINLLFKWHNLKSVINNSLKRRKIKLTEHKKWFYGQIKSKNIIKIIYYKKLPIGVIRLEKKKYNYFISYLIIPSHRKRGFALNSLKLFLNKIKSKKVIKIVALVKKNNLPSIKIFKKLNFTLILNKSNVLTFKYKL